MASGVLVRLSWCLLWLPLCLLHVGSSREDWTLQPHNEHFTRDHAHALGTLYNGETTGFAPVRPQITPLELHAALRDIQRSLVLPDIRSKCPSHACRSVKQLATGCIGIVLRTGSALEAQEANARSKVIQASGQPDLWESLARMFDRFKIAVGYAAPTEQPAGLLQQLQADLGEATTLTWQQRMWAFGGAVVLTAIFWGLVRARQPASRCAMYHIAGAASGPQAFQQCGDI
jgi:hypothetical protein